MKGELKVSVFSIFSGDDQKELPPFKEQLKKFIATFKLKWNKKSRKFTIAMTIVGVVIFYLTGVITTVVRFFSQAGSLGLENAETPSLNMFNVFIAVFDFRYSIYALLIVSLLIAIILFWYIRNHITLGDATVEERSGAVYKKQVQDATLGSARELNEDEIAKNFMVVSEQELNKNNPGTIILGKMIKSDNYLMTKKFDSPLSAPNQNSLVCGGADSRKTTNFIMPLIMQLAVQGANMFINDPSGELFSLSYNYLKAEKYNIRVFNTVNFNKTDTWNFIGSVGKDESLTKVFAQTIIESTQIPGMPSEQYFTDGMLNILTALMLYVNTDNHTNTIGEVINLITGYDLEGLTTLFHALDKNSLAYKYYKVFETAPVQGNFLNNLAMRLTIFLQEEISHMCSNEGIDIIKEFGSSDVKTAVFMITSDNDTTYSFLSTLFFNAATKLLSSYARDYCEGRILPRKLHFIMDELCTTAHLPELGQKLSADRKYGLVFHLVIQSWPQFLRKYEELEAKEIISNCKYKLCFSAGEMDTAEYWEKYCGPATVRTSMTAGSNPIIKATDQVREGQQQRMLWDYNEIFTMAQEEYLLFVTNLHPIKLKKPFYKFLPNHELIKEVSLNEFVPGASIEKPVSEIKSKEQVIKDDLNKQIENSKKTNYMNIHPIVENLKELEKISESPKMKQKYFNNVEIFNRPFVNADEVRYNIKNGLTYFKEKNSSGKVMQAYKMRFRIDNSTEIAGEIPPNMWVSYRKKIDINKLTDLCRLKKDGYIHCGWTCIKEVTGDKKDIYYSPTKSSVLTVPQSSIILTPIFRLVNGARTNAKQMTLDLAEKRSDPSFMSNNLTERKIIKRNKDIVNLMDDDL